jgi:hypothetical protein
LFNSSIKSWSQKSQNLKFRFIFSIFLLSPFDRCWRC